MEKKFIVVPKGRITEFEEKLADFNVSKYTADFHLMELIKKFRSLDFEDSILKDAWGTEYDKKITNLNEFFKFASLLPVYFFDTNERKKVLENNFSQQFRNALKIYFKCIASDDVGYEAYSILLNNSNMKGFVIRNETLVRRGEYRFKVRDKRNMNTREYPQDNIELNDSKNSF